jgi:Lrp/AsnC family transcriptional regulator, regulator for asnA, asnC and gidA
MQMIESNHAALDALDFNLLVLLQKDGRKSFTELADELNVSVSTVRNRVTKLLEDKTLEIIGRVDPAKVGFNAYAQVFITVRPVTVLNQVADQLLKKEEVSFLALTTGNYDIEVNLMCRNNNHLTNVMSQLQQIEGIFETKTNMYFKILKLEQPDLNLVRQTVVDAEPQEQILALK